MKLPTEHVDGPMDYAVREAMVRLGLKSDIDRDLVSALADARVCTAYVLETADPGQRMLRMRLLAALSDDCAPTLRVNLARAYEAYIMGEKGSAP